MKINIAQWGSFKGKDILRIEAEPTGAGLRAVFSNFGATLVSLELRFDSGESIPVVYPLNSLQQYLLADYYPGAIIGRFANRIGGATFKIGEKRYFLSENGPGYSLHGGDEGLSHKVWQLKEAYSHGNEAFIRLDLFSPDGDQGYPGNLSVEVCYRVVGFRFSVSYEAQSDQPTHVNLTTHGYFNLSGFRTGVHQHTLKLKADKFLAVDDHIVATGELIEAEGTPLDFRKGMSLAEGMQRLGSIYNHCLVLTQTGMQEPAAEIFSPDSNMHMNIFTTQPAFQLYTPVERPLQQHPSFPLSRIATGQPWAFCLEPQHLPNSPNIPLFPSTLLLPGEKYSHNTVFEFFKK